MVSDRESRESTVRVNRKKELVPVTSGTVGHEMIGIAYLTEEDADKIKHKVEILCQNHHYDNAFWEEALYEKNHLIVSAKVAASADVVEINTYEQLRELDRSSNQLNCEAIHLIAQILHADSSEITGLTVLKKGMTNRSFLFSCRNKKYIMRIPGEGTDHLINRKQEAAVYEAIAESQISDDVKYINPENGYKITEFLPDARVCDPNDQKDLISCMHRLREFHESKLTVDHEFNIWEQIEFYESLWNSAHSVYRDYAETKEYVLNLRSYIEKNITQKVLSHIDAVPDNFLFYKTGEKEKVRLIDWEYAGMQDPHVDIAMFCIYALYEKKQIDNLIDIYFDGICPEQTRLKIYCYIAACGLLWSNWCEYKRSLGVDFGEYSLRQYRYAKDYSRLAAAEIQGY